MHPPSGREIVTHPLATLGAHEPTHGRPSPARGARLRFGHGRARLPVALDAFVRPRLRQHDRRGGARARDLHGRPRPRQRTGRGAERRFDPFGPTLSSSWASRRLPSSRCRCCERFHGLYASVGPLRDLTGAGDVLARGFAAAVVLLPATLLLGATVPLAVEFLARAGRDLNEALGRLYLVNTLGGALGVALGPLVLLPALGVRGSFVAAALVNLVIGGVAWRWSQELAGDEAPLPVREPKDAPPRDTASRACPSSRASPPLRGPSRSASR